MPSFDVVSKIDQHELINAVDQANREVKTRFDFKNTDSKFELNKDIITLTSPNKFQLQQMQQILEPKLVKRGIELSCLKHGEINESLHEAKQEITIKHGIDHDLGKKINKLLKESKLKVQSSVMGDQVRVTAKKRDDLQDIIAVLQKEDLGIPLQFENFRD
jgi:cyclic-di-GMP-binding protein